MTAEVVAVTGFKITTYQLTLLVVLVSWPIVIFAILFLMSALEDRLTRTEARTPEEAGLEPSRGADEREVKIVVGDKVVGEPQRGSGEPVAEHRGG